MIPQSLSSYFTFAQISLYNKMNQTGNKWGHLFGGKTIMVILALLILAFCKETVLLDQLSSKNDRILFRLLQETHAYIQYERYINNFEYYCRNILKNHLTKNSPIPIHTIPATIDSNHISFTAPAADDKATALARRLDQLLDILNGQCLHYSTSTFIYEYCHKEHVRQFDSIYTKHNNAKTEFEDISMGLFNPHKSSIRKIRMGTKEPTPEQRKTTPPPHSNFSTDYNFLTAEDIDNLHGELEIEESADGRVVFTNTHLSQSDSYITQAPLFLSLTCAHPNGSQFINHAIMVAPYTLLYTSKKAPCDNFIDFKLLPVNVEYYKDDSAQPIRAYGKFLYGNVEEVCTANLAWQRSSDSDLDSHLEEGSLLYLQFFNNNTQKVENTHVVVRRVITGELIEVDYDVGKSFRVIQQYEDLNLSVVWSARGISKFITCRTIFRKRLDYQKHLDFTYVGNKIVQMKGSRFEYKGERGDNIGCIGRSYIDNNLTVIDLDMTVMRHLFLDYYHVSIQTNTNIYAPSYMMEPIISESKHLHCYPFLAPSATPPPQDSPAFTSIVKLCKRTPTFHFPNDVDSYYYIINIKQEGIIKLITKGKDGTIYTYLLTEGQIVKMTEFANGTKEIIKENRYYENATRPENSLFQNYIYIKVSRLPNATLIAAIWKFQDNVFFPRFQFAGEQLLKLQRSSGYAYIRVLAFAKMRRAQSLAIASWVKHLASHYSMDEKVMNEEQSLFLNHSYSINYTYHSGKFCDAPVNKMRQTTATLKCGHSWFQITKLFETSPCEYWLEIQTALLCREGEREVVQSDETLLNRDQEDRVINNGVMCFPSDQLFDEAPPYVYLSKQIMQKLIDV